MDKELLQIIKDCKKKKSKAQRKMYDRYASMVMAVCMRYMSDRERAQDMLQDSFVKLFDKIDKYDSTGNFDAWVRRLTANTCLDQLRKDKKQLMDVHIDDVQIDGKYSTILDKMGADDIMEVVMELPDGYRTVFNLYAVEGYSHKEIAEMMNISENTSKSQYSRAKKLLRDRLEELKIVEV